VLLRSSMNCVFIGTSPVESATVCCVIEVKLSSVYFRV